MSSTFDYPDHRTSRLKNLDARWKVAGFFIAMSCMAFLQTPPCLHDCSCGILAFTHGYLAGFQMVAATHIMDNTGNAFIYHTDTFSNSWGIFFGMGLIQGK